MVIEIMGEDVFSKSYSKKFKSKSAKGSAIYVKTNGGYDVTVYVNDEITSGY